MDHKLLVPLLSTKNLDSLPPWTLCFSLKMMRFHYSIVHVPGKTLCTADTLSRSPVDSQQETTLQEETENFVEAIVSHLLATESQLDKYRNAQKDDSLCSAIKEYSEKGWPSKCQITSDLKQYSQGFSRHHSVTTSTKCKNDCCSLFDGENMSKPRCGSCYH